MGARQLMLTLRRVDQDSQQVELRLAAPARDPKRILPLFERGLGDVDAGFGIEQVSLEATLVLPLASEQITSAATNDDTDKLNDLITPHWHPNRPWKTFNASCLPTAIFPNAVSWWHLPPIRRAQGTLGSGCARDRLRHVSPRTQFMAKAPHHLQRFSWRRMSFSIARTTGPERITPEWWLEDDNWRSGLRDYWKVETRQGRRLWLFYTPQNPGWFVQGRICMSNRKQYPVCSTGPASLCRIVCHLQFHLSDRRIPS